MTPLPNPDQGPSAEEQGRSHGAESKQSSSTGYDPWDHWYRRALPIYWVFLACVTHFPKLSIPGRIPQSDKLTHLGAFALLTFLLWRFLERVPRRQRTYGARLLSGRVVLIALAAIAVYAALDEYTQPLFGRDADVNDWLADVTGAGIVFAVLEWRRRKQIRSATSRA